MASRVPQSTDDVTVYLVLNDHGNLGRAYVETDPAESDLETIIRNFLDDQYENAIRVVAFNTAEGWSRDVSEDIALELLRRATDEDEDLGPGTRRFVCHHVADPANAPEPAAAANRIEWLMKPDVEKRPPAPSVRRGPEHRIKRRPGSSE
jgi:hypothetical protein